MYRATRRLAGTSRPARQSVRAAAALSVILLGLVPLGLVPLGLVALAAPAAADVVAGREAFDRGDYDRAVLEWQSSADNGDPEAQCRLAGIYETGLGPVRQDYKRADYWYRLAAEQGNTQAQYRLALIWEAGGDGFPADYVEAYKWASIAADSKGVWSSTASELKRQLEAVLTPVERESGAQRAALWQRERQATRTPPPGPRPGTKPEAKPDVKPDAKPEVRIVPPAPLPEPQHEASLSPAPSSPAAPAVEPARQPIENPDCPGWPFPTPPCRDQFPGLQAALTRPLPPLPPPIPDPPATPPRLPPDLALQQLEWALAGSDCPAVEARLAAGDSLVLSGFLPEADERGRIIETAARFFPDTSPKLDLRVVSRPLCQTLAEIAAWRRAGLARQDGIAVRFARGGTVLRNGEVIEVAVTAPAYPVQLHIDYFSLDGEVLHLAPNQFLPAPSLAAGVTQVFGRFGKGHDWLAGGAPYGTEMIAVTATPGALDLGRRPLTEKAADYLRDLKQVLSRSEAASGKPPVIGTLLFDTAER